jgi:predicted transcriptional regulator
MSEISRIFNQNGGEVRKDRETILKFLAEGPMTVSDIAQKIELPKKLIVWNLLGLLRWGKVDILEEKDKELVYTLKEL